MSDARFQDAVFSDQPLRIAAEGPDDVPVISALVQDAVGLTGDISWMPRRRRLVLLLNRFRWEDHASADRQGRTPERVRAALIIDGALKVRSLGLDPTEKDTIFAVLSIGFDAAEDGAGSLSIVLAGDGELVLEVEALDVRLTDLTRPWEARGIPEHDPD